MSVRAVFVITGLSTGGSEMMLLKLLERIDRTRFEPHVISLSDNGEIGPRIEALGIEVDVISMRPTWMIPFRFFRLVSRLKTLKPDLVHTWMYHSDLLGGLAARLAGIRAVGWRVNHSNLDPELNKWSTLRVMSVCARVSSWLPRRILSCSERARRVHIEAGYAPEKFVFVPNGFDLARFRPDAGARASVRAELRIDENAPLVGIVGRFHPQKNIEGFVAAATIVGRKRPDVHFLLAGSGLDVQNTVLQSAIRNSMTPGGFHLLGKREDIPRLMASLDVLVLSSHGEAFPNVVGEGMACGLPCVVTDAGDAAEIVGDTGRVVATGDMAGLARETLAILDLPVSERQSLGLKARSRVSENYDIDRVVQRYAQFHESLMGRAH